MERAFLQREPMHEFCGRCDQCRAEARRNMTLLIIQHLPESRSLGLAYLSEIARNVGDELCAITDPAERHSTALSALEIVVEFILERREERRAARELEAMPSQSLMVH